MIRNLRTLGIAAVAALAMVAMGATAAQAAEGDIEAKEYPATVKGTQANENVLSNGIRSVSCAEANLSGTLSGPGKTITIQPLYSSCTGNGNTTATVNMNGCDYTLHVTERTNASTGHGKVTVDCEVGKSIQIDIWATGKKHTEAKLCRLEVPAQGPLAGIEYHNRTKPSGKKYIELTIKINTLRVLRTEGTAVNCGAAEKVNATYEGPGGEAAKIEATALNEGGTEIDLFIA